MFNMSKVTKKRHENDVIDVILASEQRHSGIFIASFWIDFTHLYGVSIGDFDRVNGGWDRRFCKHENN